MSKDKDGTAMITAATPVKTNLATVYTVLAATVILAGGIVSVKRDISDLATGQKTQQDATRELRDDVNKIMFHVLPKLGAKP